MLLEGLSNVVTRWLRIPPGTTIRKADGPTTSSAYDRYADPLSNEHIRSIVTITVNDVCIGDKPLTLTHSSSTPDEYVEQFNQIKDEANSIVKWAASDLCLYGYSLFSASVVDNRLVLLPYNEDVEFYLTKSKRVVVYRTDDRTYSQNIQDLLVFINYEKRDLEKVEETTKRHNDSLAFKINPAPMQVRNVARTLSAIDAIETAIVRKRALSRYARWVNVDIGVSQGDKQKVVVDTIASSINANSASLVQDGGTYEFDDNIPVIPNRRGVGKPDVEESNPTSVEDNLTDLQYFLNKLFLSTSFPGTYSDFSRTLGETAVSTIRADARYGKLCATIRSKIESTLTDWVNESEKFTQYSPVFYLSAPPSTESADIILALSESVDFAEKTENFVVGTDSGEDPKGTLHRLQMLQDLFSTTTQSTFIQKWIADYITYLKERAKIPEAVMQEEEFDIPNDEF